VRARTCLFASSKAQLRRLELYYKHSRSSFKDREGRTKILEELSKHGETEGQAKLHTWSMNRRTKEKRQAAQADMARITGEARADVPQQQTVKTPDPVTLYLEESNSEACRVFHPLHRRWHPRCTEVPIILLFKIGVS